jgi:hypothetical protein
MTVEPPRLNRAQLLKNPHAALEYEIAQEKASALGRLGRRLEAALAALSAFDAEHASQSARAPDRAEARRALAADAGVALWHFIVQREALGLRDTPRVLRDYGVPAEVHNRMGAFPVPW